MSEGNKKSGGNYKPQSFTVMGRNKRLKGERHAKRMASQNSRDPLYEDHQPAVKRGTARNIRRLPLQQAYAQKQVGGAA